MFVGFFLFTLFYNLLVKILNSNFNISWLMAYLNLKSKNTNKILLILGYFNLLNHHFLSSSPRMWNKVVPKATEKKESEKKNKIKGRGVFYNTQRLKIVIFFNGSFFYAEYAIRRSWFFCLLVPIPVTCARSVSSNHSIDFLLSLGMLTIACDCFSFSY